MLGKSKPKMSLADAYRGLDDLTSVYVSKYRVSLDQRLEAIQNEVDDVCRRLGELDEMVTSNANIAQYAHTSTTLGIRSRVVGSNIEWDEFETVLVVTLMLEDLDDVSGSMRQLGKYKRVVIDNSRYVRYVAYQKELTERRHQQANVELLIDTIDDKANEIRAKLLEIRLRDTDLAHLVDHPEVNELLK